MATDTNKLELAMLHVRHPGLTPATARFYFEAACVCLDRHHSSPVSVAIESELGARVCSAQFDTPDSTMRASHANVTDAVECGAYGVALAAVEHTEGLVAVRRAETLTGADWYLAPAGSTSDDLEACFRLEVSGTDGGNSSTISARVKAKTAQARRGRSSVPAIASVVAFRESKVVVHRVAESERP